MNASDDAIEGLLNALYQAKQEHEEYQNAFYSPYCKKEYENILQSAHGGIDKLLYALKKLPHIDRDALDTVYYEANGGDNLLMSLARTDEERSNFEVLADKMKSTLELLLKNTGKAGKRETTEFMAGMIVLEKAFTENIEKRNISKDPHSAFYKYVKLWRTQILKTPDHAPENLNIERHIEKLIKILKTKKSWTIRL